MTCASAAAGCAISCYSEQGRRQKTGGMRRTGFHPCPNTGTQFRSVYLSFWPRLQQNNLIQYSRCLSVTPPRRPRPRRAAWLLLSPLHSVASSPARRAALPAPAHSARLSSSIVRARTGSCALASCAKCYANTYCIN